MSKSPLTQLVNLTRSLNHRFLAWEAAAIRLGVIAGLLSGGLSLIFVQTATSSLDLIFAILGVFLTALIQTVGIHASIQRRIKYAICLALGAGVMTFVGCYLGNSLALTSLAFLICIPMVGLTSGADHLLSSLVLFTVDMLVIASGMPASLHDSLAYALYFSAGGLLLAVVCYVVDWLWPQPSPSSVTMQALSWQRIFHNYRRNRAFAVYLTGAVLLANTIAAILNLPQGYWVPMTALLILKADHDFSKIRITERLVGTLLGSVLAVGLLILITNKYLLALSMVPLLFFVVISLARHYGSYTLFLTIMVSALLNLVIPEGYLITEHRVIDTILGVVAVVVILSLAQLIKKVR